MNFDLEQEHELVRSTVRDFAEERVAPMAEELDRESRFPYDLVAEMAELGLMGMTIPEDYGGAGADTVSYAIAVEELTRVDSSVAITMAAHHSLGTLPIFSFGTEEQKREWLPDLASGKKLAAFGLTEPEAGSDAGATRTRAELSDGEWVITSYLAANAVILPISGWLSAEAEGSLTLRTAAGTEETVLRNTITSLVASGLSLMPDGLEQTMEKADLANLVAFLKSGN